MIVFSLRTRQAQGHLASELQDFLTKLSVFSFPLKFYFLINLHYKSININRAGKKEHPFGNKLLQFGNWITDETGEELGKGSRHSHYGVTLHQMVLTQSEKCF